MPAKEPKWIGPATDYGPLAVFFAAYMVWGLMPATGALMAATLVALVASWFVRRSIPMMAVVTAIVVGVFGGLTLWLHDETFIKIKPTIVQALFAVILLGGLLFDKPMLKYVLGKVWPIDDTGFRKLSFRFGLFFAAMALLNEAVWRTQSTDTWVMFKVWGLMGLTIVFAMTQIKVFETHRLPDPEPETRQAGDQ
jgi:intracellular septation protein